MNALAAEIALVLDQLEDKLIHTKHIQGVLGKHIRTTRGRFPRPHLQSLGQTGCRALVPVTLYFLPHALVQRKRVVDPSARTA